MAKFPRKETRRSSLRLQRECAAALEVYIFEADKLCDMLLCSINEPETVADRLDLISQRDSESRAQIEYQRARKLLLHAVHLSCTTKTSYQIPRRVGSDDSCRSSSQLDSGLNARSGDEAAKLRYIDDPSFLHSRPARGRDIPSPQTQPCPGLIRRCADLEEKTPATKSHASGLWELVVSEAKQVVRIELNLPQSHEDIVEDC